MAGSLLFGTFALTLVTAPVACIFRGHSGPFLLCSTISIYVTARMRSRALMSLSSVVNRPRCTTVSEQAANGPVMPVSIPRVALATGHMAPHHHQ